MALDFRISSADKEQTRVKKVWAAVTLLWNPEIQCRLPAHRILLRFQAHKLSVHIIIYIKKDIRIMRLWIGLILYINCFLKHVIEGKTEVMGRSGRKCEQLLNDLRKREDTGNLKRSTILHSMSSLRNRLWPIMR
jgi:hypothetical protein